MNLLDAAQRRRLETHLSRRLGELLVDTRRELDEFDALNVESEKGSLGAIARAVQRFVESGGKRLRPQLCLWTCQLCGGDAVATVALDAACGWELFHAFLLVHDDIIDAADTRRDRPSLHRELAGLDGDSAIFGANLGIVAGDLLFAAAMRLWHGCDDDCDLSLATYRRLLTVFGRVALETGIGQAADITQAHLPLADVAEKRVLAGYHAKTAAYTFEGPMLTGAILAGADEATLDRLKAYSTALGRAYQVQNDLIDLAGPATIGGDLAQQKRTLTLVRGRDLCPASERPTFDADCRAAADGPAADRLAAAERLRRRLFDLGAVDATGRLVGDLLATARAAATASDVPPPLSSGLASLLDNLESAYFRTPAAAVGA